MELDDLPVIDWDLAIKLAGNQKDLANDIHNIFIRDLKNDLTDIKHLYETENYSTLLSKIHKLHGALCYCGLPRLKYVVVNLELALKNKATNTIADLMRLFSTEATRILENYPTHPI